MNRTIAFIVDLVQDVNVLRPLLGLSRTLPDAEVRVLASTKFYERDGTGLWRRELEEICGGLDLPVATFASEFEAVRALQGRRGVLVSASESTVPGHATAHNLFRAAPPGFVKVTLQHGFECVGFLHNAAHDAAHGRRIGFAADVVCGWFEPAFLRSLAPSERSKLYVAGPPLLLEPGPRPVRDAAPEAPEHRLEGLVCENLHSVRLGGADLKALFLDAFEKFADEATRIGGTVWLRPHPGGRYTDRSGVRLPANIRKSDAPIYKEDLGRFQFAISAPSSVLFDLVLAGVPVALWQDPEGQIDCSNYPGLPIVSGPDDWFEFAGQAILNPEPLRATQEQFYKQLGIHDDVRNRYAQLLNSFN